MGRGVARDRVGAARHVHRCDGAGGSDDDVSAVGGDPAGVLASGALRVRGVHARPAHRRAVADQHRFRAGNLAAYGDSEGDQAQRYARTKEFLQLVRRLWTEEDVTFTGEYFSVTGSTVATRPVVREGRPHPRLYFGGASAAAERVSAAEADVQLFWGEPLDGVAERIDRLKGLQAELGREHSPLEYGLRITTLVRDTTEQAWADAEAKVAKMAEGNGGEFFRDPQRIKAVGQQRLLDLANQGDVLDDNLYTAPGKYGGGGAGTTWLVGSAEDVAKSLRKYRDLGITPAS